MKQLYFVVFLFITSFSIAQTDSTKVKNDSLATLFSITEAAKQYLPNYAPLSPNAASFQKFGDYGVNLATGLPTIEIPLYIVKAGGLELPITLSYHASGHKINELASWVGWGWNLNYGAALSRSINRNADDLEVSNGSYLSNSSFSKNVCLNINDKNEAEMARVGSWDTEPDLLSYSTPESGGKFMLRTGGQPPFMMPWQATKINKITDTGFNKIKAFEVINPSGNLYYFGIDQNGNEATESISSGNSYEGFPVDGIVSWHLTKVLSPTSDDAIYCYYQDGGSLQQKLSSWSGSINYDLVGVPLSAAMIPQEYILARTNTQKNIQKIVFPNGEVEFIQSAAGVRLDPGSPCLQTINIYSFENGVKTLRKRINFIYSYFTDRLGNNGRLKLDQLIFLDENLANPQIHTFEYETNHYSWFYDGNDPSDMVNQDYFGYFNNKGNTHTIDAASFGVGSNIVQVAGGAADRSTVEQYMKEGVLNKIKFPTGGFTTFQYEANQYKNNGGIKIGGGLRVKEIKSFTDVSTMATRKTYTYGSSDGAGIGKTTVELSTPIYKTAGIFYPTGTYYTATINSNGFSEGSYDGTPIYYEFAAETQQTPTSTGNGRTEYTYSFERDIAISTPDYATRSIHPWRRGLLLTEKMYAENATLVKEVSNVYQELKTETLLNSGKFFYFAAANVPSSCPSGLLQGFIGGTNTAPMFKYASATNATGNNKLSQKTETIDGVTTITNYSYDSYLLPIKTISDNSQAASFHIKTSIFPTHSSYNANSIALALRTQNRIGIPLETIEKDSTAGVATTVFHQKTVYDSFAGTNSRNLLNNILPKEIWVAPTNVGLEKRVEFVSYDTNGNPTEYSVDGRSTSLVWGYNGSLLLGQVQNATASEVTTALATAGINAAAYSVTGLSASQLTALQAFQASLPHSLVQWYTHSPHIGLSSTLSPNGLRTSYAYDGFGRLQSIKDNVGYLTDYFRYQYASQPIGAIGQLQVSPDKNAVVHSKFWRRTTGSTEYNEPFSATTTIQYLDGLGRPIQKVGFLQNSDSWNDVILENTTYNAYGNVVRSTLPTPADLTANGYNGSYKPYAELAASIFYNDTAPFQETTEFDNSPLNRPKVMYGAGQVWRDSLRNTQFFYGAAGTDVPFYTRATNGNITRSGNYPANTLFKQISVDEQRDTTVTITDKQGRIVEKRVQDASGYIVTHYVYDAMGRPLAVIQPEGYRTGGNFTYNSANYQNSIFAYEYDERGRIKRKHVPNGGWTNYVYDKLDRVVLEQSAQQATTNKWSFTKYDALGRVALTGELESTASQTNLQTAFNGVATPYETRNVNTYSLVSYPSGTVTGAYTEYQLYYYDNYDWIKPQWEFDTNFIFNEPTLTLQNAKGLHTGFWTRNSITTGDVLHTVFYYDDKNRVIQQHSVTPQGSVYLSDSITVTARQFYFGGRPKSEYVRYKKYVSLDSDKYFTTGTDYLLNDINEISYKYNRISENFVSVGYDDFTEYDGIKRIKQQKINPFKNYRAGALPDYVYLPPNPTAPKSQTARKAVIFNEGTLINPQSTGTYSATIDPNAPSFAYGLQTIDYAYHIRGGLRGINLDGSGNAVPNAGEGDLFAYKLDYESGTPAAAGKWDGNIGKQTWATNTEAQRSYLYTYDPAKRLKIATYQGVGTENYSLQGLNYDKNGNIKNLQRFGKTAATTYELIDNLTYTRNGNRLQSLTDASSSPEGFKESPWGGGFSFGFYADGSLKSDDNEQIQNIVYDTFLKQPTEVQLFDGRKIKNYYDGGGTLLKTVYYSAQNTVIETWEFRQGMIFKNGLPYQLTTPDGRAVFNPSDSTWHYEFDYKDHLGNTRVSFRDSSGVLVKTAETAFDPYGVKLPIGVNNATQNRWEMQGKEKESTFNLNRINFGNRTLNPTTGVWDRVDEMSEKNHFESGYVYLHNSPLKYIDPDGKDAILVINRLNALKNASEG